MEDIRNYQKELEKIIEKLMSERTLDAQAAMGEKQPQRLLLHSCCAPCSSYVLEYLRRFFEITVFYYNPNISMEPEYRKRVEEQKRLIAAYNKMLGQAGTCILEDTQAVTVLGSDYEAQTEPQDRLQIKSQDGLGLEPKGGLQGRTELRMNQNGNLSVLYPIEIIEGDYEPERFFETVRGLEDCPEGGERCFKCYELRLRKTSQIAASGKYDYFATTLTISPLKNAHKLNEIGEKLAKECGVKWLPSDFKKKGGYQRSIELSKEYGLYRQDYCGCIYSKQERYNKK